jgi:hypothetical protein
VREPSTSEERWRWWEAAISGLDPPIHEDEPHAGFFKVRRFRYGEWVGGPFVPARIWWAPPDIDPDTGELAAPEKLLAEIDGKPADPWRNWTWIAARPITEEEWLWLKALSPLLPTKIPPKRPAA